MITYLIIYIVSASLMYLWVHKAYNKNGVFYGDDVDGMFLLMACVPLLNTIALIGWLVLYPTKGKNKSFTNKFFRIKKEDEL